MNKALNFTAAVIVIASLIGFIYFAYHPITNPCVSRSTPSPHGVDIDPTVCQDTESTNWVGIGTSLAVCIAGLMIGNSKPIASKKKK